MPRTPAARAATIATRIFEPEGSAAAYRLGSLARAFTEARYRTTVLTTQTRPKATPKSGVRRWPVLRDKTGAVRGYIPFASFDIPLFFRLLFGPRADVVVVEPPPTAGIISRAACWLRRTPYVYFSADVATSAVRGMGTHRAVVTVVWLMERAALRGARLVLAISPAVRDEVISLGADPDKVVMVGTGIDAERFSPGPDVADPGNPYLIYTGMMSEFQGADIFIRAFGEIAEQHPDATLEMFGAGVELDSIKALANKVAGDRIHFHGTVSSAELVPWLRGANAGLASIKPGLGYDFAFPTKALASTGCGTPVIYAGAGPLRELVAENDIGWSVDWDAHAVGAAMEAALVAPTTPQNRTRIAEWTRSNYSLAAVAARAVDAIGNVLLTDG